MLDTSGPADRDLALHRSAGDVTGEDPGAAAAVAGDGRTEPQAKPGPAARHPDRRRTTRDYALGVPCPRCGAIAGSRCVNARFEERISCHAERHHQALAGGAPRAKPRTYPEQGRAVGTVSPGGPAQPERAALDSGTSAWHQGSPGHVAGPARQ
jgi:hypothetical protein